MPQADCMPNGWEHTGGRFVPTGAEDSLGSDQANYLNLWENHPKRRHFQKEEKKGRRKRAKEEGVRPWKENFELSIHHVFPFSMPDPSVFDQKGHFDQKLRPKGSGLNFWQITGASSFLMCQELRPDPLFFCKFRSVEKMENGELTPIIPQNAGARRTPTPPAIIFLVVFRLFILVPISLC